MEKSLDNKQELKRDLRHFTIFWLILLFSFYLEGIFDFKTYRGFGFIYGILQFFVVLLIPRVYIDISIKIIALTEKKLLLTNFLVLVIPIFLSFLLVDYSYDFEYLRTINKSFFLAIYNINWVFILFITIFIWISIPKQPNLKIKFDINKFIEFIKTDKLIKSRNDIISYGNALIIITFILAFITKISPERFSPFQSNYLIKYNDIGYELLSKIDLNFTLSISYLLHFYLLYLIFWIVLIIKKPHLVFSTVNKN